LQRRRERGGKTLCGIELIVKLDQAHCYLSVQLVALHYNEARLGIDGEQIPPRQERVADLGVKGVGLVLIGGLDPAHYFSCGDGDQSSWLVEPHKLCRTVWRCSQHWGLRGTDLVWMPRAL
jgi:hypothetical protein